MLAPFCGQPAVIKPMVSLLPLRTRLHGDGVGSIATSAHSPFAQGAPLGRMPGMSPPHPRHRQTFSVAAREDAGNARGGNSGDGGDGDSNSRRSRGNGNSRQGGRRQPLRLNDNSSQRRSDQASQRSGPAGQQPPRPDDRADGGKEHLQRRQQDQQRGGQPQRSPRLGDRGRRAPSGGRRSGPSMRLPDRPPRSSSAGSSDSSEQLDDVLERYMGEGSGGGVRGRGRSPTQTASRTSGGDDKQRPQQRRRRTQWWQRAFAKQLGPEYERSNLGQPRKRLSKESWQKYVVGYLGKELREPENSEWRAAGVLVYTFDRGGELLMLLGRPDYSGSGLHSQRRNTWNLLGGKREAFDESANTTACREMWEESGGLLEEQHLMGQPDTVVWYPNGKYAVFPRQVQGQDDLPQRFAALKRRSRGARGSPRPTLDLAWVPLTDILDPATSVRKHIFLKSLLKQPALLAWLLEVRASYRADNGLAPTPASLPAPAKKQAAAEALRAGTAAEQQRQRQAAFLQEAEQAVAASIDEDDEAAASDDEAGFDSIDSDSEDEEEQEFDEMEEEEDVEAADAEAAAVLAAMVEPAALAVDESRYGLATALPPGVAAALDATAAEQRQQRRRLRGKAARQHWRQAVADAAVGPPTPIVGPVGWEPPLALPGLASPGDIATALTSNILGLKPTTWLTIGHELMDADVGAEDLMDRHGVPRQDAEELYGTDVLADELKRSHVVWQLRHTLSLLGRGCPVGLALQDVLVIEMLIQQAARSDKGEGSDEVQAEAARLEAEAQELNEFQAMRDSADDPTLTERGIRVLLRHALSELLRGRVSPRALMPTTDAGLVALAGHVYQLPDEELLTALKVALTGVRRRRGIEGLPSDDAQLRVNLVDELLVPPDALMRILMRNIDEEEEAKFEAARAVVLQRERARNMAEVLAMSRSNARAARQHDASKNEQPTPRLVRRYREAIILAGASSDGGGSRAAGMGPAQVDALAERMAADHLRSEQSEDPLGAMANPETDVYDLDALRSSAATSEKTFPGEPDDWWVPSDPTKQKEKEERKKRRASSGSNGSGGGSGGSSSEAAPDGEQFSADQQGGSWLQQIGGSLHHLKDSVSQATAAKIVDEVPAGVALWDTESELGRELERAILNDATGEHKKLIMRKVQAMQKVFKRLAALGYSRVAVFDQLPFTALKQEHVRSSAMLQLRSVLSCMLPAMPMEPMRQALSPANIEARAADPGSTGDAASGSEERVDPLLQAADAVEQPADDGKKGFWGGMQQALGGLVSGRPKDKPQPDTSPAAHLLNPSNVVFELESMLSGSSRFSNAEDNALLVARLGKLPDEMVRLALRAGLISQGNLLRKFEVGDHHSLPPPNSAAEDAALLQGLLSLPPDWQEIMSSLDSPDAQQQLLSKVKASESSMGKRGQKGGRAAAAAKELAEFAEEAGQNGSGGTQKPKGGRGAKGSKSKGGGGFGGKKR